MFFPLHWTILFNLSGIELYKFRILLDKMTKVSQYFWDVFGKLFSLAVSKHFRQN